MPTVVTPSLRQLRYIVELHETGHFGRAAAALGVGQSTLSVGIAELERVTGVHLVERTRRLVRFTERGEAFVTRARLVIEATSALADFTDALSVPLMGTIRIGIIPTIAPFLLPRVLADIRTTFPQLELQVREMTSERACVDLHRGGLDALLLAVVVKRGDDGTALDLDAVGAHLEPALTRENVHAQPPFYRPTYAGA